MVRHMTMATKFFENTGFSASNTVPLQDVQDHEGSLHFTDIPLDIEKKKKPKRILHFSDGVLEEYSSEEEVDNNKNTQLKPLTTDVANTKEMTWSVYLWYLTLTLGTKTLSVCDYLGENLAHFFGITTPKYQYEIDEYQRIIQEEEEQLKEDREQSAGWVSSMESNQTVMEELPVISVKFTPSAPMAKHDLRVESATLERY